MQSGSTSTMAGQDHGPSARVVGVGRIRQCLLWPEGGSSAASPGRNASTQFMLGRARSIASRAIKPDKAPVASLAPVSHQSTARDTLRVAMSLQLLASFAKLACPREKRHLMGRSVHDVPLVPEVMLRAIAMMHVEVDDCDALG